MPRPMMFLVAHAPDGLLAPGGFTGTSHRFLFKIGGRNTTTTMWCEAPSNGHNFDVWSDFNITAGVIFFMVIKSRMVSRVQG